MSEELKKRITDLFHEKSRGDKKMFYIRDVTKWLPDVDRHAVHDAVKVLLDEGVLSVLVERKLNISRAGRILSEGRRIVLLNR